MVRLVLVSHSRALAEHLVAFVRQMAGPEVRIDVAAGTGEEGSDFGTDATAVADAITDGPTDDGVVVMVDVGSAVMSAEMALEFLDEAARENVRICGAPFVEGTLSAAVQASLGSDLDTVLREAETALQQKRDAVGAAESADGPAEASSEPAAPEPGEETRLSVTAVLPNRHGLHARPAANFVRTAASFEASISVENQTTGRGPVSATSISEVARLGAVQGHELRLTASGPDAQAALNRLSSLIADGFGEPSEEASPPAAPAPDAPAPARDAPDSNGVRSGVPVVSGTAVGPAYVYRPALPDLPEEPSGDPEAEWTAVAQAVEEVREALQEEQSTYASSGSDDAAGILDAQLLLLDDETLHETVRRGLVNEQKPASRAWMDAVEAVADAYAEVEDPYLAERASDVRDVGHRVVRRLLDAPPVGIEGRDEPFILVASHLAPSEVHTLDGDRVLGVVCAAGNPTSHSAILLRSLDLPTVFDAGRAVMEVADGTRVALDGDDGRVWTEVPDALADRLQARRRQAQERKAARRAEAQAPARTQDGVRVTVEANVNQPSDAASARENGADGVGLLRTEFLFVDQDEAPDEESQVEHLTTVAEALDGRPVTVRVLDVGGDKPLRYVSLPHEANPFLGLRGIRVLLRHPELFRTQLRAILRVADAHPLRLLLPMITTAGEIRRTRELIDAARESLEADGRPAAASLDVGVMVETPASALSIESLAREVDFFSIGTNDLTQYAMAADREHGELTDLSDALAPPVLTLIQRVVDGASSCGMAASICGEIASDREAVPILVGLGLRRLSVTPPAIPSVKAQLRTLDTAEASALARQALTADNASSVRALARSFLETD